MDIQSTLSLLIQVLVMSFVALMVFDFVAGLWAVPLPPVGWQPPVIEQSTISATAPQPSPQSEIQQATSEAIAFEEIPDPWTLEPQSPHQSAPAPAVIVPFPTFQLLPPAQIPQQAQPTKRKRTAKSSTSKKSASTSTKRQSTKSRQITA
ncbi:hypothetical protein NIES4074_62950 (plasmid) [Cylindrospermum sp. NIES-4074]|nr:hypothetical protein NIES4074_62950 [Cylindrospermum sp. NIES-4074]